MPKNGFEKALELAREVDPVQAAQNCNFDYQGNSNEGTFKFNLFSKKALLQYPSFDGIFETSKKEIIPPMLTMIMYHLAKADGTPLTGEWISYADLPDGQFYIEAMRGYTSKLLVKHFGNSLENIQSSLEILGAEDFEFTADLSFRIKVLPKIQIAFLYWQGDEELPPYADFLFDSAASHYLPSDCYAILCSWITKSLIKGKLFFEEKNDNR